MSAGEGRHRALIAAGAAALSGGGAACWLLRRGAQPALDAASYLSATREVAGGHPFTTRLAPSFSNFTVVEFLDHGGRLPFVDFPVGYPLVAGVLAVVVGATAAMVVVTVSAVVAVAALVVAGARACEQATATLAMRAVAGVGIVSLSAYRVTTRSVLSEPLFCALTVGLLAALLHYRRTGRRWWACVVLSIGAGLVRFVGAPLAVLVALERRRRHGGLLRPALWGACCAVPSAANMIWANAAGGGHSAGWRGLEGEDVQSFVRSVGGWFEARQGNMELSLGGEGPTWWAWPVTILWLGVGVYAVVGLTRLVRSYLPEPLELALAASLLMTLGVIVGMAGFDSLVAPENRVMLPAGVLVLTGVAWSLRVTTWRPSWAAGVGVAAWFAIAVVPRGPYLFDKWASEPPTAEVTEATGASIVVAVDADPISWWTGLSAAYPPQATSTLTGATVDTSAIWDDVPCALASNDGVVALVDGPSFFGDVRAELERLVQDGLLITEPYDGAVVYRPVPGACSGVEPAMGRSATVGPR